MIPRPGTKTEKAIAYIRAKGSARTAEIAAHIESSVPSLCTLLDPCVAAGELLCCKVEVPGQRPQNEYRIGSGIPSLASRPELQKKPGIALAARHATHTQAPSLSALAAAAAAPAPIPPKASPVSRIELPTEISINEHGELRFQLDGKQHHLTPGQTTALGTFLLKTAALWRNE